MSSDNIEVLPDLREVEMQARIWVSRLEDDVSEEMMKEFELWMAESTRHGDAFKRVSAFWRPLDIAPRLLDYASSDVAARSLRETNGWFPFRLSRRIVLRGIAASIAAVFSVGLYLSVVETGDRLELAGGNEIVQEYGTAVGEQRTIELSDHSQVVLNTSSRLKIEYSGEYRSVILEEGEAYFQVAKDQNRPFIVKTEKGSVRAVGTAFAVKTLDKALEVSVTEGRVALSSSINVIAGEGESPVGAVTEAGIEIELGAGEAVTIKDGVRKIVELAPLELEQELDWRDGELSFDGETLEDVVASVSRYTEIEIEIADASIASKRIIAFYKIGDVERLFEALNYMPDINVVRIGDARVRIEGGI